MTLVITGSSGQLGRVYSQFVQSSSPERIIEIDLVPPDFQTSAEFLRCDLADGLAVREVASEIAAGHHDEITLVNFAGKISNLPVFGFSNGKVISASLDSWHEDFAGVFLPVLAPTLAFSIVCARKNIPLHIIQISSTSARGVAGQSSYSAAKAAIEATSKSLAKELGGMGVRLNTIRVGYSDTQSFHDNVSDEKKQSYRSRIGIGRFLQAHELAMAIEGLRVGSYMSGATIAFDGAFD